MPLRSITGRLVFWLFLCSSVIMLAAGICLYERIGSIVITSVDRTLHSKLQIITGLLHEEKGRIEMELSDVIAGEYVIPRSGHYYRVMNGDKLLAASPSLAVSDFSFSSPPAGATPNRLGETTYTSIGPDGEPVRVLRYDYAAFDRNFTITLAESLNDSYRIITQFKRFLQVTIPLGILLLCLSAWWIVRSSLRPIRAFSMTIETITHKNLTERIDTAETAKELSVLANSFNALLDRLHHLFESQKRLVADASHELKTPLSVIKTQCDVVLQKERSPQEYLEALETIRTYGRNMTRIINNLLSLARLDAGLVTTESFTSVSLKECIDEACSMTEQLANERKVPVSSSVDETLFVTGSRTALTEAFQNIIENGIRYNRPRGSVVVNAVRNGKKAIVSFSDTGVGIRPEDVKRIFERFYRSGTARESDGTGLGLSIARTVITAHGGEIAVESELGRGSCFTVSLPLMESKA